MKNNGSGVLLHQPDFQPSVELDGNARPCWGTNELPAVALKGHAILNSSTDIVMSRKAALIWLPQPCHRPLRGKERGGHMEQSLGRQSIFQIASVSSQLAPGKWISGGDDVGSRGVQAWNVKGSKPVYERTEAICTRQQQ